MSREFPRGVRACTAIAAALSPGLQALKTPDRSRVIVADAKRLTGSIDLDMALAAASPHDPRWDYGIGYATASREPDRAHWIEVHPCTDGEVKQLELKLRWLQHWLRANAGQLAKLEPTYVWISSGSTGLSPKSPARRKLAQRGLIVAGARYRIE